MFEFAGRTLSEARAQEYLDQGIWTNESFVDVLHYDVQHYPDVVHKDEGRSISYQELWDEVEAIATHLYEIGIRKGDRVALQMSNALDYVAAIFGAARIGAVGVSLQVDLGRQAILSSLRQANAKAWIIADNYRGQPLYETALELYKEVPGLAHVIYQGDEKRAPAGAITFSAVRSSGKKLPNEVIEANRPGPLDAFLIVFTSGTTGSPKGVVHYHANYLWATRAYVKNYGFEARAGILGVAPISHQTGMLVGVMMAITCGARMLLIDRFSATRVLQWIEREKPSYIVGAPPHLIHVANAPNLKSADTSSVKLFIYAGAPVPSAVLQRLQNDSGMTVGAMFGWTEGFVATATRPDDPLDAISDTVGFAIPGVEVRLIDEEGNDITGNEVPGEIWARGPIFSAGYFENPVAAHRQWDQDGWFHSGDLLRRDKNGRYQFIGRADDIINRGGTKVDPKAVEDVISAHESVERIAVIGVPHETLGQQTIACIVLKEGKAALSLQELRDFLTERGLAKFQHPDQVEFLSELPATHSGKVKKKDLRAMFSAVAQ